MTPSQLQRATGCTPALAAKFADSLSAACAFYGITTPDRLAAFLAQLGHESGSLRYTAELWGPTPQQMRYERDFTAPWPTSAAESRKPEFKRNSLAWALGNTEPGDGERFKGHGLMQKTGRFNHAKVRDRLRERFPHLDVPDFEVEPERLAETQWAALSAADDWDERGCNALADAGEFIKIGRAINRGDANSRFAANGEPDRLARWKTAKAALGVETSPGPGQAVQQQAPAAAAPEAGTAWPFPAPIESPKESTMPAAAASFAWGLASSLINVFTPLAREKISKEIQRHGVDSEAAAQITNGVIDTAKQMTGLTDPVDAVAAAKAEPAIVQQIESDTLATLERLAPLLDRVAGWEREARDATEAAMAAASSRKNEQDPYLTRSIVQIMVGLLAGDAVLIALAMWLKAPDSVLTTLVTLGVALAGGVAGKFGTRYDHAYGGSYTSGAKDIVIGELSRRPGAR